MEIEHLKEYIVFTDSLNFSKAAKDSFISEPTLRSHIKGIEDELGASLTIKKSNQLELSPMGRLFLTYTRKISHTHEEALGACQELSKNSLSLLIGTFNYSILEEILTTARDKARQNYPEAKVELRFVTSASANISALTDRRVDLTLLPRVRSLNAQNTPPLPIFPQDIDGIYIATEPLKFWTSSNNSFFDKETIFAKDLAGKTLLLGNADNMISAAPKLLEYFEKEGADISIDHQPYSSYSDYLFSTINDGFGIVLEAWHPNISARKDLRLFTVEEFSIATDLYLIFNKTELGELEKIYLEHISLLAEQRLQLCSV